MLHFPVLSRLDPGFTDGYFNKGIALEHLERFDEAIRVFDELLSRVPDNANAWYHRATALEHTGNDEDAFEAYEKARLLDPDNTGILYAKEKPCHGWGDWKMQYGYSIVHSRIEPGYGEILLDKGKALALLGRHAEAETGTRGSCSTAEETAGPPGRAGYFADRTAAI